MTRSLALYFALVLTAAANPQQARIAWDISNSGAAVSAIIQPDSLSGLQGWWSAADTNTTMTNSIPVTNNIGVAQWADKSGNSRDFVQATAGNRPKASDNALNGKRTLLFDGSDDFMDVGSSTATFKFLHTAESTVFMVWKPGLAANPNALYVGIDQSGLGGGTGFSTLYDDRASVNSTNVFRVVAWQTLGTAIYSQRIQQGATAGQYQLWSALASATNAVAADRSEIQIGDGTIYKTSTATGTSTANAAFDLTIGRQAGGTAGPLSGNIAEIIIYDRRLTTNEITGIKAYITDTWGL